MMSGAISNGGVTLKVIPTQKNTDVITYRISTGFEAVFGYLSLSDQDERMKQIAEWCIDQVENGRLKHEE